MDMKKLFVMMTAAVIPFLPTACQQQNITKDDQQNEANQAPPPLHLGAVHQVYPEQGFALLRIIGPMPKGGTVLITHPADGSNERIGNLIVSSDFAARNNIIAADIRSGSIMKGDRVFQYRNIFAKNEDDPDAVARNTERPIMDSISDDVVKELEEANIPEPEEESDVVVERPVSDPIPGYTDNAPEPEQNNKPNSSPDIPAYLNDIPDDISDWN